MSLPQSRKTSVTSCDVSLIDQSCAFNIESRPGDASDFTEPMDDILTLIQNVYDKRLKISAKDMQCINQKIHEMKNRIINKVLSTDKDDTMKRGIKMIPNKSEKSKTNDTTEWPSLQTANRGKTYSSVILKSDNDKKFETSDVCSLEGKVNQMLSSEKIEATIMSSSSTRNGDFVIKFSEHDDVSNIARKMEDNLGYKAQSRPIIIPKMTISYVPKYFYLGGLVTEVITKSNKWLEKMIEDGESFEILFTYEVKDWGSIVCRVSPKLRAEIIRRGNVIKIENRSCPIKDRVHVLQCGKCLGFGHKTKVCRREAVICTHCAGEHRWMDCPDMMEKDKLCCSNCQAASGAGNVSDEISTKHSARSHHCPVYLRHLQRQIERTSWGPGPIPRI